jgi:uncharacterized protein YecE (DUF72 family)
MTEIEILEMRIKLTRAAIRRKQEYYHYVALHGREQQRRDALYDCAQLKAELKELEEKRDEIAGGENDGKAN